MNNKYMIHCLTMDIICASHGPITRIITNDASVVYCIISCKIEREGASKQAPVVIRYGTV